ncbi:alpha/beta hydrolase family protein [Rossellomorea marisflavi]|uniref:S9 family peptidase n=1 Tax=Rossellomorea marisflavi TaxID=189381 RepID=UPI00064E43B3|nr:S9 family peptidase [Rossellomorea marisflavi]KMK95666.1 hypothetical protein VL03_05585 [Rossellomorea marisflavi]
MTKGLSSRDLLDFSFISDPQISPDGKRALFVKRTVLNDERYRSNLYHINLVTGEISPFTHGDASDTQPRWSPDGKSIVFVSDRSGKRQLWRIAADGGEAREVTSFKHGASQPVWSPDGMKIIVTAPLREGEGLEKVEESKEESKLKPFITTSMQYKSDAEGFSDGTYRQLVLLDLETGTETVLTSGPYDHGIPAFSPDGSTVAYCANRSADPERTFFSDVHELDLETLKADILTSGNLRLRLPNYSPDGETLSVLGDDMAYAGSTLTRVWTLDRKTRELTCLTEDWDVECSDVAINDMGTGTAGGAVWSKDGQSLYFAASDRGATSLYRITLKREITTIIGGKRQVYGFSMDSAQDNILFAVSQYDIPGDLFILDSTGEKRLSWENEDVLKEIELSVPQEFPIQAEDGTVLQGWIMKPVVSNETSHPLVVEIHGGPHAMYSYGFMHEFQVLASKGYGVLYTNPRGSHGYGQTFVDAVRGRYGGIDYEDIMTTLDQALETFDWIDPDRLGVTGGSYGGFMTNWIVGQTDRFKAAATQRSISNWISFFGVSDIGYYFTEWEHKTTILEDPDELWRISPLRYVKNVDTPLLILHSENDLRCPVEQAEQLYIALKQLKKETRFVRFPESNHELSRSGKPGLRLIRLDEITDWFDQYLR